ncbi:hypothetical protein [Candidatus Avelusimicrobium faecicola]|uniref:hypothetical protein n=1 Tax=Candidatus Avelusimicrobium faecicola TaxID=3416205 RepID=UPI003D1294E2
MRYILYLFTLALVFVGGMLVGNIYLPERSSSVAAAISVPDAQSAHPAIAAATLDAAQRNLHILNEALNSCPVVVGEEKERLIHQIDLFWARQDFDLKKARYELEIAKNTPGTAVTSRFAQASADYSAALKRVEKMAQDYFPQPQEEKVAEKPAKQAEAPAKQAETPAKQAEAPAKQAETPAKQAEIPAKNIAPAKTAAPKQAEEKAPAKKAQQAEPAAVTQAQTPAEPQAAHADTPQGAPTQETVVKETQADELKTAAVNAPKDAEKPQTATVQETEQAKTETDKAPRANSTPETLAETAPKATDGTAQQEKAAAPQEQATAPKATSAATPQEKAPQRTETAAQKEPDLPAPQTQPTEPKN